MLKPFFTYFGGKWRAAPHYPVPTHGHIVEPFAGAAGYSLRYASRNVTLVEKNLKVAGVWRYLMSVRPSEVLSLPLVFDSVDHLSGVAEEARWLIGFWLNKGVSAPCKTPSMWMRQKKHTGSFWGESIRTRIASQVNSIRHWRLIEGDYKDAPDVPATWFIDPPYEKAGINYPSRLQAHDYADLAAWCRARRGQVMVCESEGAAWLPFRFFREIKAMESLNGGKKSREVIWTNYEVMRELFSMVQE